MWTASHQRAKLLAIEFVLTAATDAGGNVREQVFDKLLQVWLDFGKLQIGTYHAHAAVDVVADAAGRNDAPFFRIGRAHAPDAKAIAPVNIGHGETGHLNARECGDIGHLFAGLISANLLDERIVGVDDAIDAHAGLVAFGNAPAALACRLKRSMETGGGHGEGSGVGVQGSDRCSTAVGH